jgi:hypothetical protein
MELELVSSQWYVPPVIPSRDNTIHTRKCNVEAWLKFFCVVMPANWRALNFGIFGVDIVDRLHFIQSIALSSDGENGMPKVINKLFPESSLWHSRNDIFNKLKNIIGQQVGASAFGSRLEASCVCSCSGQQRTGRQHNGGKSQLTCCPFKQINVNPLFEYTSYDNFSISKDDKKRINRMNHNQQKSSCHQ